MTLPPGHNLDLDRFVARLILWKKPDDLVTLKNPDRKLPITAVVCANGRPDLLKKLIKAGATHSLGEALVWAASANSPECVSILLDTDVKPTKRVLNSGLNDGDWSRILPFVERNPALAHEALDRNASLLHLAAFSAMLSLDAASRLIALGASVDARDIDGVTPLMKAMETKPSDAPEVVSVVKLLLESGANPNAADRWGTTALMMAAGRGAAETVTLLLDAGADPAVRNQAGQSAEGYATLRGHDEIAARLSR